MDHLRILDVVTIFAIILGPIFAVQAQTYIERRRQKRETRLRVFRTLMATRATKTAPLHVEALNLIAVDFYGDKPVLRAWDAYIDHLNTQVAFDQIWVDKTNDLFLTMMEEMGRSLGFDFPRSQIKREGYITKAQTEIENEYSAIRKGLVEVLAGRTSVPIHAAGGQAAPFQHPLAVSLPPPHAMKELKPGEKL